MRFSLHQSICAFAAAIMMIGGISSAHASLVGATIRGTLDFNDFAIGNCFDPSDVIIPGFCRPIGATAPFAEFRQTDDSPNNPTSVVMDPDPPAVLVDPLVNPLGVVPEFVYDDATSINVSLDIDATSLEVVITNISGVAPTDTPFGWTIVVSDFFNANGINISGLTPDANNASLFPGLASSVINGGDAIELFFAGRFAGGTSPPISGDPDFDIFNAFANNGELRANFAVTFVPVPAAAWLFGSAFGILGWMRRKSICSGTANG